MTKTEAIYYSIELRPQLINTSSLFSSSL